jgi:hypothetical protein
MRKVITPDILIRKEKIKFFSLPGVPLVSGGPAPLRAGGLPSLVGERWFHEGDVLTLDGQAGAVHAGQLEVITEKPLVYLQEINRWKELLGAKPPA